MHMPFDTHNPFPDGSLEQFAKHGPPPTAEDAAPEEGVEVSLLSAAKEQLARLGRDDPEVASLLAEIDAFLAKEGATSDGDLAAPPVPAPAA